MIFKEGEIYAKNFRKKFYVLPELIKYFKMINEVHLLLFLTFWKKVRKIFLLCLWSIF